MVFVQTSIYKGAGIPEPDIVGDLDPLGLEEAVEEHGLGSRFIAALGGEAGRVDELAQLVPAASSRNLQCSTWPLVLAACSHGGHS